MAFDSSQYKQSSIHRMMPCQASELTGSQSSLSWSHFEGICLEESSIKPAVQPGWKRTLMLCSFAGFLGPKSADHMKGDGCPFRANSCMRVGINV